MKELQYLNKYFIKYKFHFLLGIIITIVAQIFFVYVAKLVSKSFTDISNFLNKTSSYEVVKTELIQNLFWILLTAAIAGILTFLMRQTLIVM